MNAGVELRGAKEATQHLVAYAHRLQDWTPLWPDIAQAFVRREAIWFDRQGEGTWPPLSDPYAQWKAKVRPGKPKLVFDGDLRRSLTDASQAVLAETDSMLVLGSSDPKAKWHQFGTQKMPARPVLIPVLRLQAAIARLMKRHVNYRPILGERMYG